MRISHLLGATALAGIAVVASPAFAQATPTAEECRATPTLEGCPQVDASGQVAGEGNSTALADSAGKQGTASTLTEDAESASANEVVVTGSRIRSPNITADVPITSLGGEVVFQQSDQNIGEVLNDLPQLRSTFSQQNPGLGIGIAGLNLLDLRGLGPQRTLVLVNGRRHVPADILANAVSPDVSSIPNDLIERVDIVTGGNSAVYGSDAIAGVVNFVLRRQFDGVQLRGSASINEKGFGGSQFVSAMVGKNFASGRGNITLHGEYSRQERVFASDVPYFERARGLFGVDADAGSTLVNGGDGFPDAIFLSDVRSGSIDYRGLIQINQRNLPNGQCGNATLANDGPTNNAGVAFSCAYIFTADGRLTPQTGSRFGTGINASRIGGNGQTGREGQTVSVLPFLERYNFNLLSHFEFSPAVELFVEAKFARLDSVGNNAGPSFIQTPNGNQGNVGDFRETFRLDNPFLNPADRTTLANLILASGCNPSLQVTCPAAGNLTAAQQAQIAAGTYRFILARNLLDVGLRDEVFRRDTYRAVAGLRGTFNEDWGYEISGNYGRFEQTNTTTGYIDRQRFSLSLDAGRNPVTGAIQCRSQFDAASAIALQRTDAVSAAIRGENQARLAADIAACVPYNPFGLPDNSAAVNYFTSTVRADASLEQVVGQAFLSGDLSQLFELPGGPIRFSIGGEYRREKARYEQNDFAARGFTNAVAIPLFDPPAFEVKEAFGELQIPLLRDTPFFHELTITGAGRVSDYKGGTGTVYAYNGGAQWAPIRDIRIRGNYARAVRAPNVSETGFPLVPNFTSVTDPCNVVQINAGTQFRRANCTALVGAGNLNNLQSVTYSLPIVSGSNPNLDAETSDSYTLGAVIQPRWVRGFALSVDYYDITVNGIISAVGAQTILNNCVDFATTSNIFCSAFTRFQGPGLGPNGEQPGAVLGNSLIVAPLNFAKREARGIDVNVNYRTNVGANGRFGANFVYVHTIKRSNFEDPTNPNFENRILSEVGDPKDEFRLDTDFGYKEFTFGYRLRFIGPQYLVAYEAVKGGVNGLPPSNVDAAEPNRYPAITYSDIRFEWNVGGNSDTGAGDAAKGLRFFAGVDNVLNQLPPLGTLATGAGTAIYDFRGRAYYAGARLRF